MSFTKAFYNKLSINHFYMALLFVVIISFLISLGLNLSKIEERTDGFIRNTNVFKSAAQDEIDKGFGLGLDNIWQGDLGKRDYSLESLNVFGSWMHDDAHTGSMATRWYSVKKPGKITIAVYGSPNTPPQNNAENATSNELFAEIRNKDGSESIIKCGLNGHYTTAELWEFILDRKVSEFRIVAKDNTTDSGGWVGFSEPIKSESTFWAPIIAVFAIPSSFLYILLFIIPGFLIARYIILKGVFSKKYLLLLSITFSSLLAYCVFWIYFFNNIAGKIVSIACMISCLIWIIWRFKSYKSELLDRDFILPLALCFFVGCMYLSILYLFEIPESDFSSLANMRFVQGLPVDNIIPRTFLYKMYNFEPLSPFMGDWLASDRPPLATAILLLLYPLSIFENQTVFYQFTGTFVQLFWIPALYSLCDFFGFDGKIRYFIICGTVFSGFFIINSTFLWPKFLSTLFFTLLFLLVFDLSNEKKLTKRFVLTATMIGMSAALGLLSHGGIVFSMLALGLAVMISEKKMNWKYIAIAFSSFFLVYLPWMLFQKLIDPPGNRLFKWHLAGMVEINDLSLGEVLYQAYANLTVKNFFDRIINNYLFIFGIPSGGDQLASRAGYGSSGSWRLATFFNSFGAPLLLNIFLLILFLYFLNEYCFKQKQMEYKYKIMLYFLVLTFTIWPVLMFEKTITHHGSYFNIILIYILIAIGAKHTNREFTNIIFITNIIVFILLFVLKPNIPVKNIRFELIIPMFIMMTISAVLFFVYMHREIKMDNSLTTAQNMAKNDASP